MIDPPRPNLEFKTDHLRIVDAGSGGVTVAVDDGRGEDWPTAHIQGDEADRLRRWRIQTAPRHPFSAKLDAACQLHGTARQLAQALGVPDMNVAHWRRGVLPDEGTAERIASFFGWDQADTLARLADEFAQRAVEHRRKNN